ncbi:MAG TPA: Flp family type IVb pilin [Moraxellaceae bacterium]
MKMTTLKQKVMAFVEDESGATAIEYALIAALIAVAIIATVRATGVQVRSVFNSILTGLGGTAV